MEKKNVKRNDFLLVGGLFVIALLAYFAITWYQAANTKEAEAVVTIDGVEYGRYPLKEDCTEVIQLLDGSTNTMVIENGKADMTEASCPDQICVKHSKISKQHESIVCLPNKVVIEIENGEEAEVDTFTH